MNKRNLFLGLIIFMVGVMLSACGDGGKAAAPATKTTVKIPDSWTDETCGDCTRTYSGTFHIANDGLYLEAIGVSNTGNLFNQDTLFANLFSDFFSDPLQMGYGLAICAAQNVIYKGLAKAFGIDDINSECETSDTEVFNSNNIEDDRVGASYGGTLKVVFEDGDAAEMTLNVNSNIDEDNVDFNDIFFYSGGNKYENSEGSLLLINYNGRVRLSTLDGRIIGEFRD